MEREIPKEPKGPGSPAKEATAATEEDQEVEVIFTPEASAAEYPTGGYDEEPHGTDESDEEDEDDQDHDDDEEEDEEIFLGNNGIEDLLFSFLSARMERNFFTQATANLRNTLTESGASRTFFKRIPSKILQARTSSNHFQCANNIVLPQYEKDHHLFFVDQRRICCVNVYTSQDIPEFSVDVQFHPMCLTVNYGLVVAGGSSGQLAIFSLQDKSLQLRRLGGSFNNSVEVIYHQGMQKLVVANNDGTISIFKLPSLEKDGVLGPFPAAVNACKMSQDGKYLAAVGDFSEVFLIEITEKGFQTPIPLLPDPGVTTISAVVAGHEMIPVGEPRHMVHQYVAWNLTSTLLAVTSDTHDFVTVWNTPRRSIHARIYGAGFTFPIQFSVMKEDLLVFANRQGQIHFIDVNTCERQLLDVPNVEKINGFCFSPDFRKLYAALPTQIVEYSMNGPKSLLECCISVIQKQDPPLNIDWSVIPRELVVRVFPYNNLEVGKQVVGDRDEEEALDPEEVDPEEEVTTPPQPRLPAPKNTKIPD